LRGAKARVHACLSGNSCANFGLENHAGLQAHGQFGLDDWRFLRTMAEIFTQLTTVPCVGVTAVFLHGTLP